MQVACELSIITVNYNGLKDTCALIDTITFNDRLEVIVVDNGSSNNEAETIAEHYPKVIVIRSDKNLGFAGGNNLGIKAARGKYLYLINNDTVLYRGEKKEIVSFQPLIDRLTSCSQIGMVCPKIRFAWDDAPIQFAGYTPLTPVTLRNSSIGYGESDHGQYNAPHPTPYAHGAAMMVKREVIEKVGLLPECYFLYYEELDWSLMIRRGGYDIWYEPQSTIFHKESQATGQNSPLKTYYITRNRLLFASRNLPFANRVACYLYLVGIVWLRDLIKFTFLGRFDLAKAACRGISDFVFRT